MLVNCFLSAHKHGEQVHFGVKSVFLGTHVCASVHFTAAATHSTHSNTLTHTRWLTFLIANTTRCDFRTWNNASWSSK